MINPEQDTIRVLLNWIIPTAFLIAIIKVATKMLAKDINLIGGFLTSIISIIMGVIVGGIVFFAMYDIGHPENVSAMWKSLVATSFGTMVGDRIGKWFIYDFEIDKELDKLMRTIIKTVREIFK